MAGSGASWGALWLFFLLFSSFFLLLCFDLIGAFVIWLGSTASKGLEVEKLECGCSSTPQAHLSCISCPTPCSCHHPYCPQPHFIDPITHHAERSVLGLQQEGGHYGGTVGWRDGQQWGCPVVPPGYMR